MKNVWFFFSLLILTLSVLPCSDSAENIENNKTEIVQQYNHEKHNHNSELCPPFCSCACCGIHVYQASVQTISFRQNLIFINQKEQISFYSYLYNKKITFNIWQPPKIS